MNIQAYENSCWSGDDGLYYKIYALGSHKEKISGRIRKCTTNTFIEMDTPSDFQYEFTVISTDHLCKVVSELFINNSLVVFDLLVSDLQIVTSIDDIPQLILTRIESPKY